MLAALLLGTQAPKIVVPALGPRVELRLTVDRPTVSKDEDPGFHAVIRNNGREPLRLLEPQDGSESEIRNPAIGWKLPDLKNPEFLLRCGNTNPIEEGAFFTLAPGASREISTGWGGLAQLQPGANRVSFTYDISADRKDGGFSGMMWADGPPPELKAAGDRIAARYAALTPVKLASNVVRVVLRPTP